ncbi:MAG: YdcH family protein [Gammaproteobacteria bacterium]|nr:YdcH family protein [Gammaproteobacteria bacterium]MBU2677398.1 YdcH family protein [Gammaproteobacteria bacterium]NNC57646.1 YdcH family protein [Woeseiaceae bacterium]NNL51130.1 YdcH family protein [Woeseiaceae bacterium]
MLGEDHSLVNEFPEHLDSIAQLTRSDAAFAKAAQRYDALDKEIRHLELNGAPIEDESMNQLKHDRAVLKDALYRTLVDTS